MHVLGDSIALVSNNHNDVVDLSPVQCAKDMSHERLTGNFVQDLGLVGFHAGAESGCQNHRSAISHGSQSNAASAPFRGLLVQR